MSALDYINRAKVFFASVLLSSTAQAADMDIWQTLDLNKPSHTETVQHMRLDLNAMKEQLLLDDIEHTDNAVYQKALSVNPSIQLPLPNGNQVWVELIVDNVMDKSLAERFPSIRSYRLLGEDVSGSLTLSNQGIQAMLETAEGVVFIEPSDIAFHLDKNLQTEDQHYAIFYHQDAQKIAHEQTTLGRCEHVEHQNEHLSVHNVGAFSTISEYAGKQHKSSALKASTQSEVIIYRLALAVTGEYTQYHGGVDEAMAAMVTTVQRVNQVLARDVGVRLQLINDSAELIFDDPRTDPYSNDDKFVMMDENQAYLDRVIGSDNYDIGHVFSTFNGGVSSLGVVCRGGRKARGVTGFSRPSGDYFAISMFAHEIGHQLSAMHSFNGSSLSCKNRTAAAAYEPGSGSTIMSYAGHCGRENLQHASDPVFHSSSIAQIKYFTQKSFGAACGQRVVLDNRAPIVSAGKDFIIPVGTAFTLKGDGLDEDRDSLTYSWEQIDRGEASSVGDMNDDGTRPIFRSFLPTPESERTFPRFAQLLNPSDEMGEWLPRTERQMNFRLTARDNKGGTAYDDVLIDVTSSSGPFVIESPAGGEFYTDELDIVWDVAQTDLPPVNCSHVDILLSHDSGQDFVLLTSKTPNDGRENVLLPAGQHENVLLKVRCSDNIFFAVTQHYFSYESSVNLALSANDDDFSVLKDSVNVELDVLNNDIGMNHAQVIMQVVGDPSAGGQVEIKRIDERFMLVYTPAPGYEGDELLFYRILEEGSLREFRAQVRVQVVSANNDANDDLVVILPSADDETTQQQSASGGGALSFPYLLVLTIVLIVFSRREI